jgi:hypothetical protein
MTYDYALTQFHEFNPFIYKLLNAVSFLIPKKSRKKPIPLPIGELRIAAKRNLETVDEVRQKRNKKVAIEDKETASL